VLGHIWKACSALAWRRSRVRVSSGPLTFSLDLQVKRKEERRASPEVTHAIRVAIDLALEAREASERRAILFNLCGHEHSEEEIEEAIASIPD
jgi:tryptophan synthase beta chain